MGTKRQRDSNEDDVINESQGTDSKRQEKMDAYLTKKDSAKINREKSQVNIGEETEEVEKKHSKYNFSTPDVKGVDKRGKVKSENESKSKHKYPLDTESTEIPSKRLKINEDITVNDKNLITYYVKYEPKEKHVTNEENRKKSSSQKELPKKSKKHKKEKKSKHSHGHKHTHKHSCESDKRSKHADRKERKSHRDGSKHENESNKKRLDKEKKSTHSYTDSTESEDNSSYPHRDSEKKSKHSRKDRTDSEDSSPYPRRDSVKKTKHLHKDRTESEDSPPYPRRYSEKKVRDSHNESIPETNATYPRRDPEIHSEHSHRSFYSSDSEPSPSKDRPSYQDIPEKTSNRSYKKSEKGSGFTSKDCGGTPKKSGHCSKSDDNASSSKRYDDSTNCSRRSYSGAEGSSKDEKYSKEDKAQSLKRHSEHLDTSPSIDEKYSSEKKARHSLGFRSTLETQERHLKKEKSISPKKSQQLVKKEKSKSPKKSGQHLKKEKSKSPRKSERRFEEIFESSNTDVKERHTKNIDILKESMKGENRIKNSAERIRYLVDTGTLITTRYDFVYFFGMESPFSQFHSAIFKVQNIMYRCAEQYMMHQKAVLFGDNEIAKQIMEETKPLKMKRLGRKVRNFDAEKWGNKCIEVVTHGNMAKFSQNYLLEKSLFDTHPKIMAEASPRDCLWGIGLGASNEKAWNVRSWRGSNLLGYTLMNVRETLMRQKGEIK